MTTAAPSTTMASMAMSMTMGSMMPTGTSDGGMDMMMSGMMDMSQMYMTFYTSTETALYSMAWMPANTGQYAGTCIFLIVLAMIMRALFAFKGLQETRWAARNAQYQLRARALPTLGGGAVAPARPDQMKSALLTSDEVDGKLAAAAVGAPSALSPSPWRLSVDLPRAILVTVMGGVGYLLMLAVMTMNVGYFLSVLAGIFVGELFLGRYHVHAGGQH